MQAQQKNNIYKGKELNLENLARTSTRKSNNVNSKVRLPLKKIVSNLKTTADLLPKKREQPTKNNPLDRKTLHKVVINLKIQNFVKIQEQVQKYEEKK